MKEFFCVSAVLCNAISTKCLDKMGVLDLSVSKTATPMLVSRFSRLLVPKSSQTLQNKAGIGTVFFNGQVVPTIGPPHTWPTSFSTPLLAPFTHPTMHNMYICPEQSGCVRKCKVGARCARH